jgi:tRNA 2-thiouridine synthesizing protein A
MTDFTLDARGLLCPMPVIRAQNRVADLEPGDRLRVVCTDHGAKNDIPAWCRVNGHTVDEIQEQNNEVIVVITVGDDG